MFHVIFIIHLHFSSIPLKKIKKNMNRKIHSHFQNIMHCFGFFTKSKPHHQFGKKFIRGFLFWGGNQIALIYHTGQQKT